MPLHILLPMVVTGIPLIVLLIWWLRPTPSKPITENDALAIWNRRHPEAPASGAEVPANGSFALLETARGKGLLWHLGIDPVTRLLGPGWDIREDDKGLVLIPHDFTIPKIRLAQPNEVERKIIRAALKGALT